MVLAGGSGWTVSEVLCSSGPEDRPFEERHSSPVVAVVLAGTFQYRSQNRRELMTPGSLLLGSAGQTFECGHEHATGDRCVSFSYSSGFFERLAVDAGISRDSSRFRALRLPPRRVLSALVARLWSRLCGSAAIAWDEIALEIAGEALRLDRGISAVSVNSAPNAARSVTGIVRAIERHPEHCWPIESLAHDAGLSPYHFLRTFEQLIGVTPHQYVLRTRLRQAAIRLTTKSMKIIDVAFDCGFGDISNFNRTFRAEFGMSPRVYRTRFGRRLASA